MRPIRRALIAAHSAALPPPTTSTFVFLGEISHSPAFFRLVGTRTPTLAEFDSSARATIFNRPPQNSE